MIKSKIEYYMKEHGDTIEDVIFFYDMIVDSSCTYAYQNIVKEIAAHIWRHSDGYAILLDDYCELTLVVDDKEVGDFAIRIDYEPKFCISKIES